MVILSPSHSRPEHPFFSALAPLHSTSFGAMVWHADRSRIEPRTLPNTPKQGLPHFAPQSDFCPPTPYT